MSKRSFSTRSPPFARLPTTSEPTRAEPLPPPPARTPRRRRRPASRGRFRRRVRRPLARVRTREFFTFAAVIRGCGVRSRRVPATVARPGDSTGAATARSLGRRGPRTGRVIGQERGAVVLAVGPTNASWIVCHTPARANFADQNSTIRGGMPKSRGEHRPLAPGLQAVKHRIECVAEVGRRGPTRGIRRRQHRREDRPLRVGEVGGRIGIILRGVRYHLRGSRRRFDHPGPVGSSGPKVARTPENALPGFSRQPSLLRGF